MCKAYFASPKSVRSGKILSDLQNKAAILHQWSVKTSRRSSPRRPNPGCGTNIVLGLKHWCQGSFLPLPSLSCKSVTGFAGSSSVTALALPSLPPLCPVHHFPSRGLLFTRPRPQKSLWSLTESHKRFQYFSCYLSLSGAQCTNHPPRPTFS